MRVHVGPLPGVLEEEPGPLKVSDDAPAALWLVGVAKSEDILIASAFDASLSPAAKWLALVDEALPEGVEVFGVFAKDASGPVIPSWVPADRRERIRVLAARGEDGSLAAWDMRSSRPIEAIPEEPGKLLGLACLRSRFAISISATSLDKLGQNLDDIAANLSAGLRFKFPGSRVLATLDDLRREPQMLPKDAAADIVTVHALSDSLGGAGPTNVVVPRAEALWFTAAVSLDFAAYVAPDTPLSGCVEALLVSAGRQLAVAKRLLAAKTLRVSFGCYRPAPVGHVISLRGTDDASARQDLHRLLRLPSVPAVKPECVLPWGSNSHAHSTGKLVNPHADCGPKPGWWKGEPEDTKTAFVRGVYEYFHYMQDNIDDKNWGCAYRSLQTTVSWYRMQFYSPKDVPSIPDIQRQLKRIDEAHKDLVVGSKKWIGTIEGMYLLQDYLGADCKMMYCQNTAEMQTNASQLLQHLQLEGTPVMMGAGEYAYTLVGLCYNSSSGEAAYLIVDPHYTGTDDLKTILQKGWVGWKNLEFFEKGCQGGFVNLCLPLAPRGQEQL